MAELQEQPIPSESKCPDCGGDPTNESVAEHRLSNMGYLHDDVELECEDCDITWSVGIPIGDSPDNEELKCRSCNDEWMLIHRFKVYTEQEDTFVKMHLKCPNCYHFDITEPRQVDENDLVLTGYPQITGDVKDAEEWGWSLGDAPWGN